MAQNPFFELMREINKSIAHMKNGTNCVTNDLVIVLTNDKDRQLAFLKSSW